MFTATWQLGTTIYEQGAPNKTKNAHAVAHRRGYQKSMRTDWSAADEEDYIVLRVFKSCSLCRSVAAMLCGQCRCVRRSLFAVVYIPPSGAETVVDRCVRTPPTWDAAGSWFNSLRRRNYPYRRAWLSVTLILALPVAVSTRPSHTAWQRAVGTICWCLRYYFFHFPHFH